MIDALLNSVKDLDSCRLAYQKRSDSLHGIIAELHALVATALSTATDPDIFLQTRNIKQIKKKTHK